MKDRAAIGQVEKWHAIRSALDTIQVLCEDRHRGRHHRQRSNQVRCIVVFLA